MWNNRDFVLALQERLSLACYDELSTLRDDSSFKTNNYVQIYGAHACDRYMLPPHLVVLRAIGPRAHAACLVDFESVEVK